MPSTGDSFDSEKTLQGQFDFYAWITTAAAGDGVWMDLRGCKSATIHTKTLLSGNTLVVQVSNAPSKPDNATDGVTDVTITGSGAEQITALTKLPARWVKVDKTGTDAAEAYLHGLAR